ncbi:MAG: cob(I)yrinic acid a,c-diamide adenosyltransferase, partial [Gemmatimonadales bacterium]
VKIYTKTGDGGDTGLFGGGRVPKDHPRVRAYGEVDELSAAVGLALSLEPPQFESALLHTIQRDLFTIGAELATPDAGQLHKAMRRSGAPINESDVAALEDVIDIHEATLPVLKNFILPGGSPKAAAFHLARTVCRRAERVVAALSREAPVSPAILKYLNRLSDLLFVLARAANAQDGRADVEW